LGVLAHPVISAAIAVQGEDGSASTEPGGVGRVGLVGVEVAVESKSAVHGAVAAFSGFSEGTGAVGAVSDHAGVDGIALLSGVSARGRLRRRRTHA